MLNPNPLKLKKVNTAEMINDKMTKPDIFWFCFFVSAIYFRRYIPKIKNG